MKAADNAKQPPGPRAFVPGGQLFSFRRNPLRFMSEMAARYGDVVRFRMGPQQVFLVNDPELIRRVLVSDNDYFMKGRALQRSKRLLGEGLLTSEDPLHRRQRRLAQPAFHRARIAAYGEMMIACGVRTRESWQDGANIDIAHEMNRLTLAVVGKTLFDADVEGEADEVGEALTEMLSTLR